MAGAVTYGWSTPAAQLQFPRVVPLHDHPRCTLIKVRCRALRVTLPILTVLRDGPDATIVTGSALRQRDRACRGWCERYGAHPGECNFGMSGSAGLCVRNGGGSLSDTTDRGPGE
jgi:hypothetical protein